MCKGYHITNTCNHREAVTETMCELRWAGECEGVTGGNPRNSSRLCDACARKSKQKTPLKPDSHVSPTMWARQKAGELDTRLNRRAPGSLRPHESELVQGDNTQVTVTVTVEVSQQPGHVNGGSTPGIARNKQTASDRRGQRS
ncbi:hypothetical protein LTR17_015119 [Elasticomyces elasticus]|nr:hypothetical protein LTR17_015119 [Elasticomyces elasticus]